MRIGKICRYGATSKESSRIAAFVVLVALLAATASAADSVSVSVNDAIYLVEGDTATAKSGGPVDEETALKAKFTARVLHEQILSSNYNRKHFSAQRRAIIFADALSAERIEPWRLPLLRQEEIDANRAKAAFEKAKAQYKSWLERLVRNPRELALAVARKDYLESVAAYRENAAIYRNIIKRNGILTYENALRFMDNEVKTLQMAFARDLEDRMARSLAATPANDEAKAVPNSPPTGSEIQPAQADAANGANTTSGGPVDATRDATTGEPGRTAAATDEGAADGKQLMRDVLDRVDQEVKTPQDFNQSYDKALAIATSKVADIDYIPDVKEYADISNDIQAQGKVWKESYSGGGGLQQPARQPLTSKYAVPMFAITYSPPARRVTDRYAVRYLRQRTNFGSVAGKHTNYESTITGSGITSVYRPMTTKFAEVVYGRYKSIPGGVTLEGASPDLAFVKQVTWDAQVNVFILNDDVVYLNPIGANEMADILRVMPKDDRLGVSEGGKLLVYGALPMRNPVIANLRLLDRFLADIISGGTPIVAIGYKMAPGFDRLPTVGASGFPAAMYAAISDVRFLEDDAGELVRSDIKFETSEVAVTSSGNRSLVPDYRRIAQGDVPVALVERAKHLHNNFAYYARERIVRLGLAYGEAAAFARSLVQNKVAIDNCNGAEC